jgi:hypothetical protein
MLRQASALQIASYGTAASKMRDAMSRLGIKQTDLGKFLNPNSKNPAAVCTNFLNAKAQVPMKFRTKLAKKLELRPEDLRPDAVASTSKALAVIPKTTANGTRWVTRKAAESVAVASPLLFEVMPNGMARLRVDVVTTLEHGTAFFTAFMNTKGLFDVPQQ